MSKLVTCITAKAEAELSKKQNPGCKPQFSKDFSTLVLFRVSSQNFYSQTVDKSVRLTKDLNIIKVRKLN
jgi:hypothetical protein